MLFVIFFVVGMFSSVDSAFPSDSYVDSSLYNEEMLQDYADDQYAKYFGGSASYEDNLLLVFLTYEDDYDYAYIAWVGDHIATDINFMMGGNDTELGQALSDCVNASSYKYSLDSNLAQAMQIMTKHIKDLALDNSFTCAEQHSTNLTKFVNNTDLPMTVDTVNEALLDFTAATGIPVVIVVDEAEEVFGTPIAVGTESSGISIVTVLIVVAVVVIAVVVLKNRGKRRDDVVDGETADDRYSDSRYADFDDQYK